MYALSHMIQHVILSESLKKLQLSCPPSPCESSDEPPDTTDRGATTDNVDVTTPASETGDKLGIYQAHAWCDVCGE